MTAEPAATGVEGAAAAEAAPAGPSAASLLGLDGEHELDDLKEAAVQELGPSKKKRPKLTHAAFFDDDNGLKKILKTFPKVKFQGKGHEFDDLKVLVRNYDRWFRELHPYGEHFDDLVMKSRAVLQEKEKDAEGFFSDPRDKLHLLRFGYKNAPKDEPKSSSAAAGGKAVPEDVRLRIEENRRRALELKKQKQQAAAASTDDLPDEAAGLDELALLEIEEQRARAMELKRQRQAAVPAPAAAPPGPFDDEEEDPFGYGGGFDDSVPGAAPAAPAPAAAAQQPMDMGLDDEELFGPAAPSGPGGPAGPAGPGGAFDEPPDEEDGFDFGGMDD